MATVNPDSVAQDQLQAFVRRIESLEDEINALNGDKSEVYKEAKGNGFDTKVLRKVIADRRKDASERNEFDAVYQLYWDAVHGVVRAHVENIEEFDPETGEITDMGNPISNEPEAAMLPQTGGRISAPATVTGPVAVESPATHTEPEAIPPVADPATVASVTGDGERTASSPDAFPGATDHSKPNPWCLDPEECGLSSWEFMCLRCQRIKTERLSEKVVVQ